MRRNPVDLCSSLAQPVVVSVPQPEDEPDVTYVGTVTRARLSPLLPFRASRATL
jgi:hypothetical protein